VEQSAAALREKLKREAVVALPLVAAEVCVDGMDRCGYLFGLGVQEEILRKRRVVEAVHAERGRQTICISTQAGCAVVLPILFDGAMGLIRNLTAERWWPRFLMPLKEMEERDTGVPTDSGENAARRDGGRATKASRADWPARTNVVLMGRASAAKF